MSPGRQSKGRPDQRVHDLVAEAEAASAVRQFEITIPPGPRLVIGGGRRGLSRVRGRLLIDGLSFCSLRRHRRVIGPNGAGKTTLFRMIVGEDRRTKWFGGGQHRGSCYVDQSRDELVPDATCSTRSPVGSTGSWWAPASCTDERTCQARIQGQRPAEVGRSALGGERNRVQLAKVSRAAERLVVGRTHQRPRCRHPPGLEEALLGFPGCVVVISHDRWFLDRIATHVLAFEGDSEVAGGRGTSATTRLTQKASRRRRGQPHASVQAVGARLTRSASPILSTRDRTRWARSTRHAPRRPPDALADRRQ